MIWAFHDIDPPHGGGFIYHEENRGVQSLHLLGPSPLQQPPNTNVRHWDVTFKNVSALLCNGYLFNECIYGRSFLLIIIQQVRELVVYIRYESRDCDKQLFKAESIVNVPGKRFNSRFTTQKRILAYPNNTYRPKLNP